MRYNPHKRTFENHWVCCWQSLVRVVNDFLIRVCHYVLQRSVQWGIIQSSQAHFWKPLIAFIGIGQHLPLEKFPIAILGSTLSAPLGDSRLHWKHHECFRVLGKHFESACSYTTWENPYFVGNKRGVLLHRALTLWDLSLSCNGVGHSATRRPRPTHDTNPVNLWETDEVSDGNGVWHATQTPKHCSYRCLIPGGKTCQVECVHTFVYKDARSYTLRAANSAHISEHCSGARAVE